MTFGIVTAGADMADQDLKARKAGGRGPLIVIAWATGSLALIAVVAAAKLAAEIVAPTVLAGLFALTLSPVVRVMERRRIPSSLAAGAVVVTMILAGGTAAYLLAPSAEDWRWKAPGVIRMLERQVRSIEREINDKVDRATAGRATTLSKQESPTEAVLESGQQLVADTVLATPQVLLMVLYIAFLCYFLLAERGLILRAAMGLAIDWRMRLQTARAVRDIRQNVSSYLLTLTAINAALGTAAAAVFWATGLPNPVLWGAMVMLLNFMPYIGPMISNLVVLSVGLVTFPHFGQAVLPVALLVMLNLLEGQLVTPMVVGRRSQLGPLSVFLALAFGAWLWGAIGALVATPLLIVGATVWRRLVPERRRRRRARRPFPRAA